MRKDRPDAKIDTRVNLRVQEVARVEAAKAWKKSEYHMGAVGMFIRPNASAQEGGKPVNVMRMYTSNLKSYFPYQGESHARPDKRLWSFQRGSERSARTFVSNPNSLPFSAPGSGTPAHSAPSPPRASPGYRPLPHDTPSRSPPTGAHSHSRPRPCSPAPTPETTPL